MLQQWNTMQKIHLIHKKKNEHIYRMQEKIANMWIAIVKPLL